MKTGITVAATFALDFSTSSLPTNQVSAPRHQILKFKMFSFDRHSLSVTEHFFFFFKHLPSKLKVLKYNFVPNFSLLKNDPSHLYAHCWWDFTYWWKNLVSDLFSTATAKPDLFLFIIYKYWNTVLNTISLFSRMTPATCMLVDFKILMKESGVWSVFCSNYYARSLLVYKL